VRAPAPIARLVILTPVYFTLLMFVGTTGFYLPLFHAVGNTFFHRFGSGRIAHFDPLDDPRNMLDTRVAIGTDATGTPIYRSQLNINAVREGYAPTAVLVALVLATPIPWPRRWRALAVGLLAVQAFVMLRVVVAVLYGFSRLRVGDQRLLEVGSLGTAVLRRADQVVAGDLHLTYVAPFLIWLVVVVRLRDIRAFRQAGAARANGAVDGSRWGQLPTS
jgi:hypothetical protein